MATRSKQHRIDRLTDRIGSEVERVTDALSDKVNAELLDDQQELSQQQFLDYWRANWSDPVWRQKQLERMGADQFIEAANQAFGAPKPEPLSRLAREGMTRMAGQLAGQAVDRLQAAGRPSPPEPPASPEPPEPPASPAPSRGGY